MRKIFKIVLLFLFSTNLFSGDFVVARKIPLTNKAQMIKKVTQLFIRLEELSIDHNMSLQEVFDRIERLSKDFKKFDKTYKLKNSEDLELRILGEAVYLWYRGLDIMLHKYQTTSAVEYDHKYVLRLREQVKRFFTDKPLSIELAKSVVETHKKNSEYMCNRKPRSKVNNLCLLAISCYFETSFCLMVIGKVEQVCDTGLDSLKFDVCKSAVRTHKAFMRQQSEMSRSYLEIFIDQTRYPKDWHKNRAQLFE